MLFCRQILDLLVRHVKTLQRCKWSVVQVAEQVGVASLRRKLVAMNEEGFAIGFQAEAFGQSEALTTRLKHITCVYPRWMYPTHIRDHFLSETPERLMQDRTV